MKTKPFCILIALPFLVLSLSGCVGQLAFRSSDLPPVPSCPPRSGKQGKSVSIIMGAQRTTNGKENSVSMFHNLYLYDRAVKAYRESNLFSDVTAAFSEADLRSEIKINERIESNVALWILSELTLGVIPSYGQMNIVVRTTIRDRDGKMVGTFEKSENVAYVNHLIFLLTLNIASASWVLDSAFSDIIRLTLNQACAEGIL